MSNLAVRSNAPLATRSENKSALIVATRNNNAYTLAKLAAVEAVSFHLFNNALAGEVPGLELALRELEQVTLAGAAAAIHRYQCQL